MLSQSLLEAVSGKKRPISPVAVVGLVAGNTNTLQQANDRCQAMRSAPSQLHSTHGVLD